MIQIIGIVEVFLFYLAYFLKLCKQKRKGIKTNQLGKGNKPAKTVIIETMLRISSTIIAVVILASAMLNYSLLYNYILRWVGLIIFGIGTMFFIIAMITMKDSWRAGIPDDDRTSMVTIGIYKISRNPAFLGFDLTYIGASIAFGSIILYILTVFTMTLMHLQILEEEKFLMDTFGNEYLSYKKEVGRYITY